MVLVGKYLVSKSYVPPNSNSDYKVVKVTIQINVIDSAAK